jgi:hypothetical protein
MNTRFSAFPPIPSVTFQVTASWVLRALSTDPSAAHSYLASTAVCKGIAPIKRAPSAASPGLAAGRGRRIATLLIDFAIDSPYHSAVSHGEVGRSRVEKFARATASLTPKARGLLANLITRRHRFGRFSFFANANLMAVAQSRRAARSCRTMVAGDHRGAAL